MINSAIISDCGKYRYELCREWHHRKPKVMFMMLNPSTADENSNDLTTIRCMNFAKMWGYGGIMIGNIYPFRAKRPKHLRKWLNGGSDYAFWKSGDDNRNHVNDMVQQADMIVCAWGCNHKGIPGWISDLKDYKALHYLELCDDGITPKHPLGNLSKDLKPIPYNALAQLSGFYTN